MVDISDTFFWVSWMLILIIHDIRMFRPSNFIYRIYKFDRLARSICFWNSFIHMDWNATWIVHVVSWWASSLILGQNSKFTAILGIQLRGFYSSLYSLYVVYSQTYLTIILYHAEVLGLHFFLYVLFKQSTVKPD